MIVIDGIGYKLSVKKPNFNEGNSHVLGYVDHDTSHITLRSGLSQDRMEMTLIHEMLHPLLMNEDRIMDEDHEIVVTRLAERLYPLLKGNDMLRDGWMWSLVDEREIEDTDERSERVTVDYGNERDTASDESIRRDSDEGKIFTRGERVVEPDSA